MGKYIITLESGRCLCVSGYENNHYLRGFMKVWDEKNETQLINKRCVLSIREVRKEDVPNRFGFYV